MANSAIKPLLGLLSRCQRRPTKDRNSKAPTAMALADVVDPSTGSSRSGTGTLAQTLAAAAWRRSEMLSSQQIKSSSNSRVCKQWIHYGSPRAGRVLEFSGARLNEPDFSKSRLQGKERGPGEGGGGGFGY